MRQDQFEKLLALHEQLVDKFLEEADPTNWPGQGMLPANMDAKTRGDAYWCKKNAVATISITQRIQSLVDVIRTNGSGGAGEETPAAVAEPIEDLDEQVREAERQASKLLASVQKGSKATHGKT